jgi:hypothetical protein
MILKLFFGDRIDGHFAFTTACIGFPSYFAFNVKGKWHAKNKGHWETHDSIQDMMIKNKISFGRVITLPDTFSEKVRTKLVNTVIMSKPDRKMTAFFDDILGFTSVPGTIYSTIKMIIDEMKVEKYVQTESGYDEMIRTVSCNTVLEELDMEEESEFVRLTTSMYYIGMGVKVTPPDDWVNYYQYLNFIMNVAKEGENKFLSVTGINLISYEEFKSDWFPDNRSDFLSVYRVTVSAFLTELMCRDSVKFNESYIDLLKNFNAIQESSNDTEIEHIHHYLFEQASKIINGGYIKKPLKVPSSTKISTYLKTPGSGSEARDLSYQDRIATLIEKFIHPDEISNYTEFREKLSELGIMVQSEVSEPVIISFDNGKLTKEFNISLGETCDLSDYEMNDLHMINSIISERVGSGIINGTRGKSIMNQVSQEIRRRQIDEQQ